MTILLQTGDLPKLAQPAIVAACRNVHLDASTLNFRDLTTLILAWLSRNPLEPGTAER